MTTETEDFVQYIPGNVGIILSVPHGGCLDHPEIPDRTDIAFNNLVNNNNNANCDLPADTLVSQSRKIRTRGDGWTIDLGQEIYDTVKKGLPEGKHPHMIICHLKRSKVDVNRDILEGALDVPLAEATHKTYHAFIRKAKTMSNRGILFDIHGQSHGHNKTELGYLLTRNELNSCELDPNKSSLRCLHLERQDANCSKTTPLSSVGELSDGKLQHEKSPKVRTQASFDFEELITGPQSFGAMLENHGYQAFPSPRQQCPGNDKYYFGGYITRCHGSAISGSKDEHLVQLDCSQSIFDAIQLETPRETRMDAGEEEMRNFGKAIGRAIIDFVKKHYRKYVLDS